MLPVRPRGTSVVWRLIPVVTVGGGVHETTSGPWRWIGTCWSYAGAPPPVSGHRVSLYLPLSLSVGRIGTESGCDSRLSHSSC